MPTATALDGQVARPAPSLTHTLTASVLTAVSAAVQEKTALLTQHLAALSALAASPPPPADEPAQLFHRYETLRTQLRTLSAAVAVCELPASDEGLVRELGAFLAQPSVGAAPSRESMLRAVNDVAAGDFGAGGEDKALRAALRAAASALPPAAPAQRRPAARARVVLVRATAGAARRAVEPADQ